MFWLFLSVLVIALSALWYFTNKQNGHFNRIAKREQLRILDDEEKWRQRKQLSAPDKKV
jgi:hypothetical protein